MKYLLKIYVHNGNGNYNYISIIINNKLIFSLPLFFFRFKGPVPSEDREKVDELHKMTLKRKAQLHEIEQSLPAKSGRYLQVRPIFRWKTLFSWWKKKKQNIKMKNFSPSNETKSKVKKLYPPARQFARLVMDFETSNLDSTRLDSSWVDLSCTVLDLTSSWPSPAFFFFCRLSWAMWMSRFSTETTKFAIKMTMKSLN